MDLSWQIIVKPQLIVDNLKKKTSTEPIQTILRHWWDRDSLMVTQVNIYTEILIQKTCAHPKLGAYMWSYMIRHSFAQNTIWSLSLSPTAIKSILGSNWLLMLFMWDHDWKLMFTNVILTRSRTLFPDLVLHHLPKH